MTVCAALTIGLAFGVAASQVFVAQNQDHLDKLNTEARAAQARYEQLRFRVAELESPERVVTEAQNRLGMIEPAHVTYVTPPVSSVNTAPDVTSAADAPSWRSVKSELAAK